MTDLTDPTPGQPRSVDPPGPAATGPRGASRGERAEWVTRLRRLAHPVLSAAAAGELHRRMPVEVGTSGDADERAAYAGLEAIGRLLSGIAPWLDSAEDEVDPAERETLRELRPLAQAALATALDPGSPDRCNFTQGRQPIVDAAFLAQATLRAPRTLQMGLTGATRGHLAAALRQTRTRTPGRNNWLLFAGVIEAALHALGEPDWDRMRIDYALMQHESWYLGDGLYGDGPRLHADYYNSFVIVPMLVDLLGQVGREDPQWSDMAGAVDGRARRTAAVLEEDGRARRKLPAPGPLAYLPVRRLRAPRPSGAARPPARGVAPGQRPRRAHRGAALDARSPGDL